MVPFVGFREVEIDDELRRFLRIPSHIEKLNSFQLEWFGCALVIPLRPKNDD